MSQMGFSIGCVGAHRASGLGTRCFITVWPKNVALWRWWVIQSISKIGRFQSGVHSGVVWDTVMWTWLPGIEWTIAKSRCVSLGKKKNLDCKEWSNHVYEVCKGSGRHTTRCGGKRLGTCTAWRMYGVEETRTVTLLLNDNLYVVSWIRAWEPAWSTKSWSESAGRSIKRMELIPREDRPASTKDNHIRWAYVAGT